MNLQNLKNKEPLIKEFFTWLLDDDKIVNKDISLENEIDLTLAPYYMDANIYYPKQIANFFNTKAMQRLGRISQLDLAIDQYPNVYHNRLEHSKGVYYRKLEEMLHNFQNPSWKKQIEDSGMKLYLLADLIKMAGHDIGHLPLSHALEVQIFMCRDAHEIIGQRILLEDPEIQSALISISPNLPHVLKELYENPILNFREHDESSYDVDRFDYIFRDNLYVGKPIFIPYAHYETFPVILNESGFPEINTDGSILISPESNSTIDVYNYSSLRDIEHFLEIREHGYKHIYTSPKTHIRENCLAAFSDAFLNSDSQSGKELRNYINTLRSCNIQNFDLSLFLNWDDIKFYSQILEIAEHHEDFDIRLLATMIIPNLKAFLTMLYSHLGMYVKEQNYSDQDKAFLQKLKTIIKGQDSLSQNLKNPDFITNNILVFSPNKQLPSLYENYKNNGLIKSSCVNIKAYNSKEPIYIKGADQKIYELSNHPDRQFDWDTKITHIENMYTYIPYLRLNGLSDTEINKLRNFCNSPATQISDNKRTTVNLQPLQVGHNIEDEFLQL